MTGRIGYWKILLGVLALSAVASADVISIPASVDGDVSYNGVLGFTVDDADDRVTTSRSGGNNVRNGIYEFSLGGLPADAIVQSATLKVTTAGLISNTGPTADVSFHGYTADGAITEADHALNSAATLVASETYPTGGAGVPIGTVLDIDLVDLMPLQDAVGSDYFGVRSETVNFVSFSVHSLETGNSTAMVPTLEVTFVPEPSTALLAALGMLGVLRRR
jgi:hypothetical protein